MLERHLCNLHNEVFEAAESRINTECSLTIREGVSRTLKTSSFFGLFPHYTWGCIVLEFLFCHLHSVPSLYVRVYRAYSANMKLRGGSLTIREGVSRTNAGETTGETFPHYTWGCIKEVTRWQDDTPVPSLYVRVYRIEKDQGTTWSSSLTIREGVSVSGMRGVYEVKFPHYTWGCIDLEKISGYLSKVPSLYVRVYRMDEYRTARQSCSLTIREGVSGWIIILISNRVFPHYTWGCIEYNCYIHDISFVPSLYVRVYRKNTQNRAE